MQVRAHVRIKKRAGSTQGAGKLVGQIFQSFALLPCAYPALNGPLGCLILLRDRLEEFAFGGIALRFPVTIREESDDAVAPKDDFAF